MDIKKKRKEIMEVIVGVMNRLDKTGANADKYKKLYSEMTDAQFTKHMKKFFEDDKANFYLEMKPFENEPDISDIEKAAKFIGVPLEEKVYMPWIYQDENGAVKTEYEVPVGYINMRRVQQMVSKKNSMSINIDKRDPTTGQVVQEDKNARVSDMENAALVVMGATETLKEYNGPRADDMNMKAEFYNKIATDGYVELGSIDSKITDKTAINTLDVFFLMAGLKSNLINDGYENPKTLLDAESGKERKPDTAAAKYKADGRSKF